MKKSIFIIILCLIICPITVGLITLVVSLFSHSNYRNYDVVNVQIKPIEVTNSDNNYNYFALMIQIQYVNRYYGTSSWGGVKPGFVGIENKIENFIFKDSIGQDITEKIGGLMENEGKILILEDPVNSE